MIILLYNDNRRWVYEEKSSEEKEKTEKELTRANVVTNIEEQEGKLPVKPDDIISYAGTYGVCKLK